MGKIERKYLAHYIDVNFTYPAASTGAEYVRLGKDLEEFGENLNPQVEVTRNILGEQSIRHNGYEVQSEVGTFYAEYDDALFERLAQICNERQTGDQIMTTRVDVLLNDDGTVIEAWREDCAIIPQSYGGNTSGVQIPFTIYNTGNRVKGTWEVATKKFTVASS